MLRLFRRIGKAISGQSEKDGGEEIAPAESASTTQDTPVIPKQPKAKPTAPIPTKGNAPLIIPRSEHNLSRKKVSPNALKVMGRLIRHGYKAYLCGGCVRDILIGRIPKDFDVVTDATPDQLRKLFRNCRLIGRRFRLAHIFFQGGEIIEVSTFRKAVPFDPESDGPVFDENSYGTPSEDANRRDLTINGMFYNLETYEIYDHVGGIEDLNNRIVRIIGDPCVRIKEDPVRMVRAIRHAAGTGFDIEPITLAAIRDNAEELHKANQSRVRDEITRELCDGHAAGSFELMLDTGMLFALIPEAREIYEGSEQAQASRQHLLSNLNAIDEVIHRRQNLPLDVKLAAFVAPMVKAQNFDSAINDQHNRRAQAQHLTRDYVKPILRRLGIGKADADAAAMIILGSKAIVRALSKNPHLPKTLSRKSYFAPSLLLFQLEAFGRGERMSRPLNQLAQDRNLLLFETKRSNRRRRRNRPGNAATPPAQEPQNGDRPAEDHPNPAPRTDTSLVFQADLTMVAKSDDNQ